MLNYQRVPTTLDRSALQSDSEYQLEVGFQRLRCQLVLWVPVVLEPQYYNRQSKHQSI